MSERYQDPATLSETYNSEYCITLDELPADWKTAYADGDTSGTDNTTTTTTTVTDDTDVTTTTTTTEDSGADDTTTTTTTAVTSDSEDTTTTTTVITTVSSDSDITTDTSDSTTTTETTEGKETSEVKFGDLNLDDTVSMVDLVYMNKAIAQIVTLNDQQIANADCCFDGAVTASDASVLLQFMVLSIKELPVIPE